MTGALEKAARRADDEDMLTDRFSTAMLYAAQLHAEQTRNGTEVPYLAHLLGVASLVLEDGGDEDEAIAALLHDAVEDQGGLRTLEAIRTRFGDRVAGIVAECTDYDARGPRGPWRERKEAVLASVGGKSASGLRVALADKLSNARAIRRDFAVVGDELWTRFSAGREMLWYQRGLAGAFGSHSDSPMARELCAVVEDLERAVRESDAQRNDGQKRPASQRTTSAQAGDPGSMTSK